MVNDDGAATEGAAVAQSVAAGGIDVHIVESVPKTTKIKAQRLMEQLKSDPAIKWTDRDELMQDGAYVPRSNIVDLVHDALRKGRKNDSVGWQTFHTAAQAHQTIKGAR